MNLHTKFGSPRPYSFRQEDIRNFATWLKWQPEFCLDSKILNNFQYLPRIIPVKFGPNWPSGLGDVNC